MSLVTVTKMEATGNDFVVFSDLEDQIGLAERSAAALCDRHFGVGADGVIRITKTERGRLFMDYRNADGSLAEMCGNGIRCMARYLYDRGYPLEHVFEIETRAGTRQVSILTGADGVFEAASVDMGPASFERASIPMSPGSGDAVGEEVYLENGTSVRVTAVSMGNPHAVVWVENLRDVNVPQIGSALEEAPEFPMGVNVEFAAIKTRDQIEVRVWERGVGETLSCGTGACAVAAAAVREGVAGPELEIRLPGGALRTSVGDSVVMSGPANQVFETAIDIDALTGSHRGLR